MSLDFRRKYIILPAIIGLITGLMACALWAVIEPFFFSFLDWIGKLLIFGKMSLQSWIYQEAAKGLYERTGLYASYFIILIICFCFAREFSPYKKDYNIDKDQEDSSTKKSPRKYFFRTVVVYALLSILILSYLSILQINRIISYYSQTKTICRIYMEDNEARELDSLFARMKNKKDYKNIINKLKEKAKIHNLPLPEDRTYLN